MTKVNDKVKYQRIFVIVLDSVGMGYMPDAAKFGDEGADTLGHLGKYLHEDKMPHLRSLGLANLKAMEGIHPVEKPLGCYKRMKEQSNGKDTMTGHWEMMGIHTTKPFKTFTETGFPQELIDELEKQCGKKVIGNKSASGTEIIKELGMQEMQENAMIVYTSADSVLQICGNEKTFDLANLYRCCEIARKLTLKEEWRVGRVIARPYVGDSPENFKRTSNRHDYALKPTNKTAMDALKENGYDVLAVGKIHDIFDGEGITDSVHSVSSVNGMDQTIDYAKTDFTGLCFTNLVDFDALWGHRRNPEGYAAELERFDVKLGEFLKVLRDDDILMITADHGNDPTYTGTDHTREYVLLLLYSPKLKISGNLPESDSFADIGATIASNFGVAMPEGTIGTPMKEILD